MIVVDEEAFDDVVDEAVRLAKRVIVGGPLADSTEMGLSPGCAPPRRFRRSSWTRWSAERTFARAESEKPPGSRPPSSLSHMRVWTEEVFGPVAMGHRVGSADEAVELADGSPYGLSASLFGTNGDLIAQLARRLNSTAPVKSRGVV
jgi:acyl-CoA reductase-like NAD-dependent aldehyde dehydrogenase